MPQLAAPSTSSFDAVGGASPEANNEAVAALAGLHPSTDLLLAEWRNSPYRPCHYVAIDRANQCVVLAIRWEWKLSWEGWESGGLLGEGWFVPCCRGSLQVVGLVSDLAAAPLLLPACPHH